MTGKYIEGMVAFGILVKAYRNVQAAIWAVGLSRQYQMGLLSLR